MKTTIAEFIAPYIETKAFECLIGSKVSSIVKFEFSIELIETNDIEFDENGEFDGGYGRRILQLTEKCATINYGYGDTENVRLTDEHTIYIEQSEHEKLLCSLDLKTMEVTNY